MTGPDSLHRLLAPKSLAVIGASERSTPALGLVQALTDYGFRGPLHLVNRRGADVLGRPTFTTVADIPDLVDLALVLVPAAGVAEAVTDCARAGIRDAVVFSSGFAEEGPAGAALQAELAAITTDTGIRLLGPNCQGFLNVDAGIPVSFSSSLSFQQVSSHFLDPVTGRPLEDPTRVLETARGPVAMVAQSGGLAFSLFNKGLARGMRFSYVVSTGNEADIELLDVLEYMVEDPSTRVVMAYVEGLRSPQRLAAIAARASATQTRLVIGKVGRSAAAARAALSHTGQLAGDHAAYEAVFDRYGVISAADPEEMLDAALALSLLPPAAGNRAAIVSLSGGSAVWMADALSDVGIELPDLDPATTKRIAELLPSYASTTNPVDVSGGAEVGPAEILAVVADDPNVDALILVTTLARSQRLTVDLPSLEVLKRGAKPLLVHTYTEPGPATVQALNQLGLPLYQSPARCARALRALVVAGLAVPREDVATGDDQTRVTALRTWSGATPTVPEYLVKQVLADLGVPTTKEQLARDEEEALAAAAAIGYPVALKLQSPSLPHKAAAGGVVLGVTDDDGLRRGVASLLDISQRGGIVDLHGVLVQEMVRVSSELIVGVQNTSGLGPMVLLGLGGSMVEVIDRSVLYPAPFSVDVARQLLGRLGLQRVSRAAPGEDRLAALASLLSRVSQLAYALRDDLLELDLNPVVWDIATGDVVVADAVAVLAEPRLR
jgi:acyl-CoA synthetase (NDP forming)